MKTPQRIRLLLVGLFVLVLMAAIIVGLTNDPGKVELVLHPRETSFRIGKIIATVTLTNGTRLPVQILVFTNLLYHPFTPHSYSITQSLEGWTAHDRNPYERVYTGNGRPPVPRTLAPLNAITFQVYLMDDTQTPTKLAVDYTMIGSTNKLVRLLPAWLHKRWSSPPGGTHAAVSPPFNATGVLPE